MTRFVSSKNTFIIAFLWGIAAVLLTIIVFAIYFGEKNFLSILFVLATISLIIWILLDTRYVIKKTDLLYRSGPFRGRIDILDIKTIEKYSGTNPPVTMKPALDNNGLILNYNKNSNLFISPVETETFIKNLIKINSKIEIK